VLLLDINNEIAKKYLARHARVTGKFGFLKVFFKSSEHVRTVTVKEKLFQSRARIVMVPGGQKKHEN